MNEFQDSLSQAMTTFSVAMGDNTLVPNFSLVATIILLRGTCQCLFQDYF